MADEKKPKRVLLIEGNQSGKSAAIAQLLASAYGAGQLKQAQIAGEYPPLPVDVPKTTSTASEPQQIEPLGGTVTGRFSHKRWPWEEIPRAQIPKQTSFADVPIVEVDYAELEKRILAAVLDHRKGFEGIIIDD